MDIGHLKKVIGLFILSLMLIGLAVFLGLGRLSSGLLGPIFCVCLVALFVISAGYIVSFFVFMKTGNDRIDIVMPLTSFAIALISAIAGVIIYYFDSSMFLRGLASQIVWFFVSIPAAITAQIQFIIYTVRKNRS